MSIGMGIAIAGIWVAAAYGYSKKGDAQLFFFAMIATGVISLAIK